MQQQTFNQLLRSEIKAEMGRQDINQRELALRLGWQPSMVSRRLAGKLELTVTELEEIAAALDVPVTQLGWLHHKRPPARRSA